MINFIKNILKKETCSHGYPIQEKGKLPYKRTYQRIEVCKKCSLDSATSELKNETIKFVKKYN